MVAVHTHCVRDYLNNRYQGGLIGISDLAEYCAISEGKVLVALAELQKQGLVEIVKRYFCPEGHQVFLDDLPYCLDCNYPYSEDFMTILIYVKPLRTNSNACIVY